MVYLSLLQTGYPGSKPSNSEENPPIRQYISTYLFEKSQMREPQSIPFPEMTSTHMMQIRRSPLQIQEPNQMKIINIIVPISLGRLDTIHRFLRIWDNLFKQDRNQRLILSFSGTVSEHRNDIYSLKSLI